MTHFRSGTPSCAHLQLWEFPAQLSWCSLSQSFSCISPTLLQKFCSLHPKVTKKKKNYITASPAIGLQRGYGCHYHPFSNNTGTYHNSLDNFNILPVQEYLRNTPFTSRHNHQCSSVLPQQSSIIKWNGYRIPVCRSWIKWLSLPHREVGSSGSWVPRRTGGKAKPWDEEENWCATVHYSRKSLDTGMLTTVSHADTRMLVACQGWNVYKS